MIQIDDIPSELGRLSLSEAVSVRDLDVVTAKLFFLKGLLRKFYGLKFEEDKFAEVVEYLKSHNFSDYVQKFMRE